MTAPATVLVTGVGRGIGLGLARAYLAAGSRVIGTVRDATAFAAPLADALGAGRLALLEADVRDASGLAAAAAAVDEPIDALIASAGVMGRSADTLSSDPQSYLDVFDVNVLGPLRTVQAFRPHLLRAVAERGAAKVLVLSSRMGEFAGASSSAMPYRVSKAAVNKLMQGLATDLAPHGVAVASCHPGWVRTDMGGAAAPLSVEDSVAGLMRIVERLDAAHAGGFYDVDGTRLRF